MNYQIYTTLKNDGYWAEHKDKGYLDAYVDVNGQIYHVDFIELYNMRNRLFPEDYNISKKYPLNVGDIVVREITKMDIKKTIDVLIRDGYFDHIKPMQGITKISDIKFPPPLENTLLYPLK